MSELKPIHSQEFNNLLLRRDELLKQNPSLQELQFKINDLLAGAGTQQNKNILLKKLMLESMNELKDKLDDLQVSLKCLRDECDK